MREKMPPGLSTDTHAVNRQVSDFETSYSRLGGLKVNRGNRKSSMMHQHLEVGDEVSDFELGTEDSAHPRLSCTRG
jgi:hypothetical protein